MKPRWWIMSDIADVARWCDRMLEFSRYELLYRSMVLSFEPRDDGEALLFKLKWGHLLNT